MDIWKGIRVRCYGGKKEGKQKEKKEEGGGESETASSEKGQSGILA